MSDNNFDYSLFEGLDDSVESSNKLLTNIYRVTSDIKDKLLSGGNSSIGNTNSNSSNNTSSNTNSNSNTSNSVNGVVDDFRESVKNVTRNFGVFDNEFARLSKRLMSVADVFSSGSDDYLQALNDMTRAFAEKARSLGFDFSGDKEKKLSSMNELINNLLKERNKFEIETSDKTYIDIVLREQKRFLEEKRRVQSIDENLLNIEKRILEKRLEVQEASDKQKKDSENAQLSIDTRKEIIANKYNIKKYRGTGEERYLAAMKEWYEFMSQFKQTLSENSRSRNIGIGVTKGINTLNNGWRAIDSGKMNTASIANGLTNAMSKLGVWGQAGGAFVQVLQAAYETYSKVDKAASDYARTVGGGAAAQAMIKNSINSTVRALNEFGKVTYDTEEMIKLLGETSVNVGRDLSHLSQMDMRAIDNLKKMAIDGGVIADYDTLGISMENVSKRINALYSSSSKHGVNAKAAVSMMTKNLAMSQKYTFAGGVKALERMAEKSTALKINMQMAETLANKVMTLEGAMSSGARLSVLGGSFSNQSNPLSMLYGGLQDPEMLFNKMLETTKGMAYFDRGKGMMDISAFNRERIRAAAEAYGIDSGEMMKAALNQGRLARVNSQIRGNIDSDTAEYIRNIASIDENGNAYIETHDANGEVIGKRNISDLTNNDKEMLRRESQLKEGKENGDMGDVVNNTRSIQDKLDDYVNFMKQYLVKAVLHIANWFSFGNKFSLPEDNDRAFASGGFISGPGTSTSDSINAKLSNGEFVVNANATKAHRGLLESINNEGNKYASGGIVRPSGNNMKFLTVLPRNNSFGVSSNINSDGNRIIIEPINISGTIRLEMNGSNRNISADELLNNATFIRQLSNAIEKQVHIGYRRDESQFKFTR